ncbi:universal stress protein [Dyadobacter chenhuakuii]|uniref:Universal stress protein n=1 Tax=Dyadobacter chenhuakuii TaxID=2909339 RepID=A0ABY4XMJ1_9BACT|nr:universal stress protein [Dyadobacter chenhuakuii]MCF2494104.1 universal stress protein [Dyadobacter chenhuakuii]USJ31232.1 universal stress protein [Dyadobacter chenhuakuii]
MKNILLAINPEKPSIPCMQFGCYLAQLTQSRLTAVFGEKHLAGESPALKTVFGVPYVETILGSDLPGYAEHEEMRAIYMETFTKICEDRGVRHSINPDLTSPREGLIQESRFSDLLVIAKDTSLEHKTGQSPSDFIRDIIVKAECPVIVAPITFTEIDEILLAYDESRSSAFAVKQFSYLFPEMDELKLTMLHVNESGHENELQREKLSHWLSAHFNYAAFKAVSGKAGPELYKYLYDKKRTLVIMGSYGRTSFSTLLSPSTADSLLENLDLPFFFAHH